MHAPSTATVLHAPAPETADAAVLRDRSALAFAQADRRLEDAECARAAALRAALAAHLAQLRTPDEPCPACGSSAAPAPALDEATAQAALARTEHELAHARSAWDAARAALDEACVALVLSPRPASPAEGRRLHS